MQGNFHETSHMFFVASASPEALDNHAGTTCGRQWYGKTVCSSTCAISGGILRETNSFGNVARFFWFVLPWIDRNPPTDFCLELSSLEWYYGGSSNAKGMFFMVKRNLAVAHNCHSIYCLGLVVCVASLSCFVLSWIWPGWSSKQSCETWGGVYSCYY